MTILDLDGNILNWRNGELFEEAFARNGYKTEPRFRFGDYSADLAVISIYGPEADQPANKPFIIELMNNYEGRYFAAKDEYSALELASTLAPLCSLTIQGAIFKDIQTHVHP